MAGTNPNIFKRWYYLHQAHVMALAGDFELRFMLDDYYFEIQPDDGNERKAAALLSEIIDRIKVHRESRRALEHGGRGISPAFQSEERKP